MKTPKMFSEAAGNATAPKRAQNRYEMPKGGGASRHMIPPRFRKASIQDFDDVPLSCQAADPYGEYPRDILITGAVAKGKSHLAGALCNHWQPWRDGHYKHPLGVEFITAAQILAEVKKTFGDPYSNPEDVIRIFTNCRLLVIDDLGAENTSEFARDTLLQIINKRYEQMMVTVVTSNEPLDGLAKLDNRIASRISSYRQIEILGEDQRIGADGE